MLKHPVVYQDVTGSEFRFVVWSSQAKDLFSASDVARCVPRLRAESTCRTQGQRPPSGVARECASFGLVPSAGSVGRLDKSLDLSTRSADASVPNRTPRVFTVPRARRLCRTEHLACSRRLPRKRESPGLYGVHPSREIERFGSRAIGIHRDSSRITGSSEPAGVLGPGTDSSESTSSTELSDAMRHRIPCESIRRSSEHHGNCCCH